MQLKNISDFLKTEKPKSIKNFLIKNEPFCISVSNRFIECGVFTLPSILTDKVTIFFEEENCKKNIIGIIDSTITGNIFHYFEKLPNDICKADFLKIINPNWIYCVTGEEKGTDFILQQIKKNIGLTPYYVIEYFFETIKENFLLQKHQSDEQNAKINVYDFIVHIAKNTTEEIEALLPLRLQYENEEVNPPGSESNPNATRKHLEKIISYDKMFYLTKKDIAQKNKAITTVALNAHGFTYEQIGGVFTDPDFRNQGAAYFLINHVVKEIYAQNKTPCLFVKQNNLPAQKAYEKNGFEKCNNFKIAYFSQDTDKTVKIGR